MTTHHHTDFTYDSNNGHLLVAEASELGWPPGRRPREITIVGRQRPERFVLAGHDANGGDVAGWRYRACNTTLAALGVRVLVIND